MADRRYKPLPDTKIATPEDSDRAEREDREAIRELQRDARKFATGSELSSARDDLSSIESSLDSHAAGGLDEHADSHGERVIVLPAALAQGARGEDQYFFVAGTFSDPRGYLGSMTTQKVEADIPANPWLRGGDRITQVRYRIFGDGSNTIAMRIKTINGFGQQTTVASDSSTTANHHWVTFDDTDLGPHTVDDAPLLFGVELPSTSSLSDCRFLWCEVTYDRP